MSSLAASSRPAGRFHVKSLTQSMFFVLISLIAAADLRDDRVLHGEGRARKPEALLYVALGAGLMGIWSSTLFGSGGAIQWQRWQGTLELLVAAPPPFIVVAACR